MIQLTGDEVSCLAEGGVTTGDDDAVLEEDADEEASSNLKTRYSPLFCTFTPSGGVNWVTAAGEAEAGESEAG